MQYNKNVEHFVARHNIELMWGLVYNGLCSFAFTIKCLSSYIKTLVLSMMLFSFFFVRRRDSSPLSCSQFKSNERIS